MVLIERLTESYIESVLKVTLSEEQVKFSCTSENFLSRDNDTIHLHVIKFNDEVVGFFKIDIAYSSNYEFCPENGIGLRAFAIDINQQSKGLGSKAVQALFSYLTENYAAYESIYLTANCKNVSAFACYQKSGFHYTGEKYLGGSAGPQYIMQGNIA